MSPLGEMILAVYKTASLFFPIAAIKPVGGKTTSGAVRRQHQGMSDSEVYQDDHVPEGARPNRWQSLHMVCKYQNHHKPVYSLQRHLDVWHVGASAKMRFTESLGNYAG